MVGLAVGPAEVGAIEEVGPTVGNRVVGLCV